MLSITEVSIADKLSILSPTIIEPPQVFQMWVIYIYLDSWESAHKCQSHLHVNPLT